jgi:hypothetical protein
MMLTHYYAIAPAVAIAAYILLRFRGLARRQALGAIVFAAIAFILLWGWGAWRQRLNVAANNWWIHDTYPGSFAARTAWRLALLPFRFLHEPLRRAEPAAAITAALYLLPPLLIIIPRRRRLDLLLWWLLLICAVGMVLIADIMRHAKQLDFIRYTAPAAAPAVYEIIAALVRSSRDHPRTRWLAHALPAAALASCLFALPQTYEQTLTPKPDWREPAALIDRLATPDDILLFCSEGQDRGQVGSQYLALRHYATRLPRAAVFVARPPLGPDVLSRLGRAAAVWVITDRDQPLETKGLPGFVPKERSLVFGLPSVQRWEQQRSPAQ